MGTQTRTEFSVIELITPSWGSRLLRSTRAKILVGERTSSPCDALMKMTMTRASVKLNLKTTDLAKAFGTVCPGREGEKASTRWCQSVRRSEQHSRGNMQGLELYQPHLKIPSLSFVDF